MKKELLTKLNSLEKKEKVFEKEAFSFNSASEEVCGSVGLGEGQSLIPNPILKKKKAEESQENSWRNFVIDDHRDFIIYNRAVNILEDGNLLIPSNDEEEKVLKIIQSQLAKYSKNSEKFLYLKRLSSILKETGPSDWEKIVSNLYFEAEQIVKKYVKSFNSDELSSTEAYLNEGKFDEEQEFVLDVLEQEGHNIRKYVTPNNSPEQMIELGKSMSLGISGEDLKILANPEVSYLALQVVNSAWKKKINLIEFLPWADPFVLKQAFLGIKKGLDTSRFIKPGLDHRQIEQLRKELESGGNPEELTGNYNEMRAKRFPGSNISNSKLKIPKGQGVSTHSKKNI